jgi:hypothetical protein
MLPRRCLHMVARRAAIPAAEAWTACVSLMVEEFSPIACGGQRGCQGGAAVVMSLVLRDILYVPGAAKRVDGVWRVKDVSTKWD